MTETPAPLVFSAHEPPRDCAACPRLAAFRASNQVAYPAFFNAPVPAFGAADASVRLLIVGLAPGLKGANQTGRPFTGDYAGDLLYATLLRFGLAVGNYDKAADDGLSLVGCRITNAVRCVPPENKPTGDEVRACAGFLRSELSALSDVRCILALGALSHGAILTVLGEKKSAYRFAHCAQHRLTNGLILADSYHCSRYNTNTGRLTEAMFAQVFEGLLPLIRDA
ncbi:MAG: uracil-DNA glycosylase [Alphaproteobacteria bacterium]|nr:uracil-DNA glycosylase [Alphaproteobacteria bacterium]